MERKKGHALLRMFLFFVCVLCLCECGCPHWVFRDPLCVCDCVAPYVLIDVCLCVRSWFVVLACVVFIFCVLFCLEKKKREVVKGEMN